MALSAPSAGVDSARLLYRISDHDYRWLPSYPLDLLEVDKVDKDTGQVPRSGMKYGALEVMVEGKRLPVCWIEGRPIQLLQGAGVDELLPPSELGEAEARARELLRELGVKRVEPLGVSRLDLTAEKDFTNPQDTVAVMRGMAQVRVPYRKPVVWFGKDGRPETVYWATLKSGAKRERAYRAGLTHTGVDPERRLRFESQVRFSRNDRLMAEQINPTNARDTFRHRFGALAKGAKSLRITDSSTIVDRLADLVRQGDLTAVQAERLVGYITMRRQGVEDLYTQPTRWRRDDQLAELGLAVAYDSPAGCDPVEIALGEVLDELLDGHTWN